MSKVTFSPHVDDFRHVLRRTVEDYFKDRNLATRDSAYMYAKAAFFVSLLVASYITLVFYSQDLVMAMFAALVVGSTHWGIGFNVMHDANHKAFSKSKVVNRIFGRTLDFLLGASSYFWEERHNHQHHSYTNIVGHDSDIEHQPFARFSRDQAWRWYHRYQQLYMWPLYSLVHIGFIYGDLHRLVFRRNGLRALAIPKGWGLAELVAGKVIYFTFAFVIPMIYHPWWIVLLFYAGISLYTGFVLGVIGQLSHMVEIVDHPAVVTGSSQEWTRHQIATTAGFATNSRVCLFLFGGLNCQPVHHVFPQIAHKHYPALSKILERVCIDFGVPYYSNPTLFAALRSHYRLLKLLGRA